MHLAQQTRIRVLSTDKPLYTVVPSSFQRTPRPSKPLTPIAQNSVDNMFSETYPPSLTFTGFMQKTKRSAATMDPEQLIAFSARPRSRKRKSLPDITDPLSLSQSCGIPEEPSLILNTLSEEEVEEDLQKLLSSSLDDLPLDSISSSQLSTVTPTPTSSEDQFEKSSEAGLPKTTPTPRSSASSTSPTAKRPNASSSSSTPALAKPQLQFINKSAPAMSRPKPQQGAGVYVQTQSAIQQRVRKRLREEGKVKRSSNCFIKYRTYMHPIIVARFGNQNNKEISRLAGRCWKNEPESVKSIYRQQAAEEKVRHATLYPTYKFTPARPTHKGGDGSRSSSKSKAQSSMSVHPSSPSSIHGSEGSNDDAAVQPAEKSPTEHHSPRQNARADKAATSTADAPSRSKPPVERGFVVTETALYDFTGNAELSEKKHSQSKSRSGSRPNRLNRRLCALQDPLSLEISMASAAPANTLAFIPQSPMTPVASSPAVPSRVSALSQGLAHQQSSAMPTTPVFPLAPTISSTSPHPPTRWNKMVGQPTLRVVIPQQQQQQQWNIPQSSSALMQPSPALMTPANATFQGNINVSGTALVTDQNWAKQLLSPQSVSPFVQQGATNLLQIPQPSTPIPIPVQPVASRKLSGSFGSQIYFGLLYGSQSPSVSMATTLTPVSSAPLATMHVQHGMVPPSPMHSHPTTVRSQSVSEPTFEKLFTSNGFVALTIPQVSNEMFGDAVWTAKDVPSTPLVTNSWECPALQTPSQDVMDLDQQLLFPVSSTNSSLATSPESSASFLSVTPGNIYPAMTMSTWTTLGDSSRVPSSPVVQSNNNNFNRNDINSTTTNSNGLGVGANLASSGGGGDQGQGHSHARQPFPLGPMKNQPLAWSDEEQLRMSISYYEELVQQQKMILSLQRQLREQA